MKFEYLKMLVRRSTCSEGRKLFRGTFYQRGTPLWSVLEDF